MTNSPDWRAEIEKTTKELGSPALLAGYWLGFTVVLYLVGLATGKGIPGVFNTIIIVLSAIPFAIGAGWLTVRSKRKKGS